MIIALAPGALRAHELSEDVLPPQMREGAVPPDRVLYGVFLRHEAAFEKLARANESKGLSGDAYRNHFIQKFGLTPDEQRQIGEIALNYDEQWSGLREQAKSAARDFRALNSPIIAGYTGRLCRRSLPS